MLTFSSQHPSRTRATCDLHPRRAQNISMSSFIESAYPTKAAYDAAKQSKPAIPAAEEANVKAGFEKLTTMERFTSLAARRSLGDGNKIPVVGLGLYYTPPGAVTYDIVAAALKHGYRCAPHNIVCNATASRVMRTLTLPSSVPCLQAPRYRGFLRERGGRRPRCP